MGNCLGQFAVIVGLRQIEALRTMLPWPPALSHHPACNGPMPGQEGAQENMFLCLRRVSQFSSQRETGLRSNAETEICRVTI